jgi:hypothetical protein
MAGATSGSIGPAPDLKERLLNAGLDPVDIPLEQLPAFMRREQERYAAIIRGANIKVG